MCRSCILSGCIPYIPRCLTAEWVPEQEQASSRQRGPALTLQVGNAGKIIHFLDVTLTKDSRALLRPYFALLAADEENAGLGLFSYIRRRLCIKKIFRSTTLSGLHFGSLAIKNTFSIIVFLMTKRKTKCIILRRVLVASRGFYTCRTC